MFGQVACRCGYAPGVGLKCAFGFRRIYYIFVRRQTGVPHRIELSNQLNNLAMSKVLIIGAGGVGTVVALLVLAGFLYLLFRPHKEVGMRKARTKHMAKA